MSSSSSDLIPPPQSHGIVLACGQLCLDYLVAVRSFPKPDDKIVTTNFKVQGGGNTGNALACAARLGLVSRIIAKIADDSHGKWMLEEIESYGVDTSFCMVSKGGTSHFNYIIVDNQTNTRTCLFTPGYPPILPDDLSDSHIETALDGVRIIYANGRSREAELLLAQKASSKNIPILVDPEKKRKGVDELLCLADYAVCSVNFPQEWTEAPSLPTALVSMLVKLPKLKFVIVTLGEEGCIMIERCHSDNSELEEIDIESLLQSMKQSIDHTSTMPICISSRVTSLKGNVTGRVFIGTTEKIPISELIDTTGAGDAFVGALLYGLCANMPPETMLPLASRVAACCCRGLGPRSTLPFRIDPRLAAFML